MLDLKVAICAIIRDENLYLEEWLNHYRKLGVDYFFIYDNDSSIPVSNFLFENQIASQDIQVIKWSDHERSSQQRAYLACCQANQSFDYIGFFDLDEFYYSKTMKIKKDLIYLHRKYGEFSGFAIYWRMYGSKNPFFQTRRGINEYQYYFESDVIKSFLNPKDVIIFPDPHKAIINGSYFDERGKTIIKPSGLHSSKMCWIKHTWTRSIVEFEEKIKRGSGDKVIRKYSTEDFYNYNKKCTLIEINTIFKEKPILFLSLVFKNKIYKIKLFLYEISLSSVIAFLKKAAYKLLRIFR